MDEGYRSVAGDGTTRSCYPRAVVCELLHGARPGVEECPGERSSRRCRPDGATQPTTGKKCREQSDERDGEGSEGDPIGDAADSACPLRTRERSMHRVSRAHGDILGAGAKHPGGPLTAESALQ